MFYIIQIAIDRIQRRSRTGAVPQSLAVQCGPCASALVAQSNKQPERFRSVGPVGRRGSSASSVANRLRLVCREGQQCISARVSLAASHSRIPLPAIPNRITETAPSPAPVVMETDGQVAHRPECSSTAAPEQIGHANPAARDRQDSRPSRSVYFKSLCPHDSQNLLKH